MDRKPSTASVTKAVTNAALNGLLLALATALLLAWGGREVAFTGTPDPTADRAVMMGQWAQESIDAQLADLGCDKTQRLTETVAVRNSARTKAGAVQFDTTVVRVEGFDAAWAAAQRGQIYVVGWCK